MKKGFTLIELLVVVLIIGILAAVALPQYNRAVAKSRLAEALVNGKALRGAMDRYTLENGQPPAKFEELDIGIAGEECADSSSSDCLLSDAVMYSINKPKTIVRASSQKGIVRGLIFQFWENNVIYCFAYKDGGNHAAQAALCKSFSGERSSSHDTPAHEAYLLNI